MDRREYHSLSDNRECAQTPSYLRQITPVPSSQPEISNDIALSTTLLGPIALLSSHLTFLQLTLPQTSVTSLYRTIASRLATHILNRQILYRGRSRITPEQGKVILAECELWAETCRLALAKTASGRTEAPWRGLLEAGRIVGADGESWRKIVDSTFGVLGDDEWEKALTDVVGFSELGREDVGQVIRARTDSE